MEEVIIQVAPQRILDIGCGSGRLFPLYRKLSIKEVIAQDISSKALDICRERWPLDNIVLINQPLRALVFPELHFDLSISNRVLQHVPPAEIEGVISILARMTRSIYINEMTESDYNGGYFFMFKHDYESFFLKHSFHLIKSGRLDRQQWMLWACKSNCG